MVAGYVVMRIALVGQWLRAAKQDPQRRSACLTYAAFVTVAQIGWAGGIFLSHVGAVTFAIVAVLIGFEIPRPVAGREAHGRHAVARAPHRRAL